MPKPNLFLVGALKSATTSLYRYLGQHPDIFMSRIKEPTYFGSDLVAHRFVRDRDQYLALFDGARHEKVVGEASPWYLYSKRAAAEIAEFEPRAKILISLRNPVDVMYSAYWQQVFNGNEDIDDFSAALAAEPERAVGKRVPPGRFLKAGILYRDLVFFTEQVRRYFDCFTAEQIHILLFDDLVCQPRAVYRDILDFLDVDTDFEPHMSVANRNKRVRSRFVQRFLDSPPGWALAGVRVALPLSARRRIRESLRRINWRVGDRPSLDEGLREKLQQELAPEIQQLGSVINRDLSHWYDDEDRIR